MKKRQGDKMKYRYFQFMDDMNKFNSKLSNKEVWTGFHYTKSGKIVGHYMKKI